jgi:transposase InsO family protein
MPAARIFFQLIADLVVYLGLLIRPRKAIAAENLFYRSPKANSLCERLIGSLRRECLDWAIPLSEGHLRSLLKMWSTYYNPVSRPRSNRYIVAIKMGRRQGARREHI